MKSTHLTGLTAEDEDKNNIGSTIVQTISKDPLMQRVGIVVNVTDTWTIGPGTPAHDTFKYKIYWQPSFSMPMPRPYATDHLLDTLGEHYFVA